MEPLAQTRASPRSPEPTPPTQDPHMSIDPAERPLEARGLVGLLVVSVASWVAIIAFVRWLL